MSFPNNHLDSGFRRNDDGLQGRSIRTGLKTGASKFKPARGRLLPQGAL